MRYIWLFLVGVAILLIAGYVLLRNTSAPAQAVLSLAGYQISLSGVNGKHIECMGEPSGYIMGYFYEEGGAREVAYFKEGDSLTEITSWFRSRAVECGYTKSSESIAALPGVEGTSMTYTKPDEEITASIFKIFSGGKKYTIIHMKHEKWAEEGYQQGSSDTTPGEDSGGTQATPPVIPTGKAAEWHSVLSPVLANVFGGATLTNFSDITDGVMTASTLEYELARKASHSDFQRLKAELEAMGWEQLSAFSEPDHIVVAYQTPDNFIMSFETYTGGHSLSVIATPRG